MRRDLFGDWYGSRGIKEIRYSQRHIWRWRDWIVDSLLGDKPYDQMLVEMLAGDELTPTDSDVLRATGFLGRNWYKFDRNVWMFETVEQTSQAFLGLTLRCARCHDHKYDPISQEDYYRFRAFFEPHNVRTDPLTAGTPQEKDATLGMVLKDGVARVFDKAPDAKTFLFQRGDDRSPDESRPLALMNSSLALDQARTLAERLSPSADEPDGEPARTEFVTAAWETVLSRPPTERELAACLIFLDENVAQIQNSDQTVFPAGGQTFRRVPSSRPHQRARENLIHVLDSHNDFVSIR